jgi:hypothetical protein
LEVKAIGLPPLGYQWELNGAPLAGATNSTLILTNIASIQSGSYKVTISNQYGSVPSASASVLAIAQPTLSIDLDRQMLLVGTGGADYEIQYLEQWQSGAAWQPLLQVSLPGDSSSTDLQQASFADPADPAQQRFYRAIALGSTEQQ